ncbi:hypothetical protein [Thomasclavelia cocleata]|uniref:hypothetical protein n=1 Tax=Thomasclavelia cocleata TaxID=69824 RepID=UPI00272DAB48|nr:hypothetical protein [Thomasclavelia cocleata]
MVKGNYKYELYKRDSLFGYVKYECLEQNNKLTIRQSIYLKGINATSDVMIVDKNGKIENIILSGSGRKICEITRVCNNQYILDKDTYISFKALKYYPLMIYQEENFEIQSNIFCEKTVLNYTLKSGMYFDNLVYSIEGKKLTILSPGRLRCEYATNGLLKACFDATTEYRMKLK